MKYNTKFVIKGQVNNDDKIVFTYPKPFDSVLHSSEDEWLKSLPETRVARNFDSDKVYVYWKNEYGNYYSLIIPNSNDSRNGMLILTIFTDKNIVSSGKMVVDTLLKLGNVFGPIVENLRMGLSQEIIEALDNRLSVLEESYCKDSTYNGSAEKKYAYRFYSTREELDNIMQFPNQEEYRLYKKVLIVPSGSINSQLSSDFEEIKSKVKKTYRVSGNIPDGVKIDTDKRAFVEGESMKLIYYKDGYVGVPQKIIIDGKSNKYIRYEGTTLHLCSPDEAGVNFDRGLYLQFQSKRGDVQSVTILYGGQRHGFTSGNLFIFSDDRNEYRLTVYANGYQEKDVLITLDDIRFSKKIIELTPENKTLKISFETKDGKKEGYVSIDADDPLFPYFKQASDSRIPINHSKKESQIRGLNNGDNESKPTGSGFLNILFENNSFSLKRTLIILLLIIFGVYALYCFYMISEYKTPWPFDNKKEKIEDTDWTPVVVPEESTAFYPEQTDIVYLKQQDIWTKDSIKSEKYQELYDFISEGKIDEILDKNINEWFPDNKNTLWVDCYEILRAIKDQNDNDKLSRAQDKMKSLSDGSIPLKKLKEALRLVDNPPVEETPSVPQGNNGKNGSNINGSGSNSKPSKPNNIVGATSTANGRPTSGH